MIKETDSASKAKAREDVVEEAKSTLEKGHDGPSESHPIDEARKKLPPPVLIVDCLRVYPHTSHFG